MKNQTVTLSLLSVLAIFASLNANAQPLTNNELAQATAPQALTAPTPAPVFPNAITVKNNADHSAWITIYNSFGSIRDSGCVVVGDYIKFNNYYGPIPYKVRAEITTDTNCGGRVIFDTNMQVGMPLTGEGVGVTIEKSSTGYYLN